MSISSKLETLNNAMIDLLEEYRPVFDVFPDDETLAALSNNTTFGTKGFYAIGDGAECTYLYTKTYYNNAMKKGDYYIYPLS